MYKKYMKVMTLLLASYSVPVLADIDMQKGMYDSAKEMMAMDENMNRAILEHKKSDPKWDESIELKVMSIHDFEEKKNSYVLEREIDDVNQTKVDVKLENGKLTISTTTTVIEKTEFSESKSISSSSTSLFIPNDADENRMEQSYENGLLKIVFPKK
jgi:HSP20 family molecular chaperone IbpA